jgi:hypothetical protein
MGLLESWRRYIKNKFFHGIKITGGPIFIVGCGHSGTSLLLSILGAHSKIFAVPYESRVAAQCTWRFRLAMRTFDRWAIAHGKNRWAEKTPKHILRIDSILKQRLDARILLIIRDGRDVACSLQRRHGDLELGIRRWVDHNTEGKKYWDHPKVHVFKYESLITDFETTMKEILAFLGEEYEPQLKDYHKSPRLFYSDKIEKPDSESKGNHDQFRNWQINQPIFDNRGKWKQLSEAEKARLHEIGSDLLNELGYV